MPVVSVYEEDFKNGNAAETPTSSSFNGSTAASSSTLSRSTNHDLSSKSITNLPRGWEVRIDKVGHLVYVDHFNRRTTWNPPVILERAYLEEAEGRYGNARRTVLSSNSDDLKSSMTSSVFNNNNETHSTSEREKIEDSVLCFLRREDFMRILHKNESALKMYNESTHLKHILQRLRKDRAQFEDFENNAEVVAFLNLFADSTLPLPAGWELAKQQGKTSQKLFVDHNRKKITLVDPRLPVQSESSVRGLDVNRNLILDALGDVALRQYADEADCVRAISIIDEKSTTKSEFEEKVHYFYSSLQRAGYAQGPNRIRFTLRRSHLLNDAFEKILSVDSSVLRKSKMSVTFAEEDGLDFGGVSKELFFLLSRDLFNPYYSLFEYSTNSYNVQIGSMSKFVDNFLSWMTLCGRVLGLALIHRCQIDSFFSTATYKMLLGMPYTTDDVESIDNQFYNSLMWIRNNPIADLDFTFSITTELAGEIVETELVPGGRNLLVNDLNKDHFITLLTKWRLERNVGEQMKALLRGFYSVIDRECVRIFDPSQLEVVLSGKVEVDLNDWRKNTEYKGGYYDSHVVISWFWTVVCELCNAERLKLLQFVTGTISVPHEGFQALRGSDGLKKFSIEKWGTADHLPRAHTCFNRLDLPAYPTMKILKEKLLMAVNESRQFAIE